MVIRLVADFFLFFFIGFNMLLFVELLFVFLFQASKSDSPPKSDGKETHRRRLLENYLQQQQMFVTEKMNDVDKYLAEEPVNPMTSSFDILLWWKDNSNRYKILSMIAKDVLAIPVSTVASESAFSTSGRILDSFRSSLSPKMVEALVCTQNWLKGSHEGIQTREYLDDIQAYEFLEEGKQNDFLIMSLLYCFLFSISV